MRKLFTLLIIVLMTTLLSLNVFAAKAPVWSKYMSKTYEERTEDGEKIYAIGGLTQSYSSPGLEIGSLIKEHANSESITLTISFDARVNFIDNDDPVDVQLDAIFRGGDLADILKEKDTMKDIWEENYEGSFFKYVSGNLIMAYGFKGSKLTFNEEWQTFTLEFELFQEDLGVGLFNQWYFCFQNYTPIEVIEALEFKNTIVTVTGEGEAPANPPTPKTEVPTQTAAPASTKAPDSDTDNEISADNAEAERPVITKDPSKTVAPDSALSSIIANSCSCNDTLPIIAIVISSIALLASVCAIILIIRKKQ